ncbi:MAG: hypothetical protein J1E34_03170 [Oscillospiraceae bacterium]|nr:hypothetical protein [Oscillospiraceae bacterium]
MDEQEIYAINNACSSINELVLKVQKAMVEEQENTASFLAEWNGEAAESFKKKHSALCEMIQKKIVLLLRDNKGISDYVENLKNGGSLA